MRFPQILWTCTGFSVIYAVPHRVTNLLPSFLQVSCCVSNLLLMGIILWKKALNLFPSLSPFKMSCSYSIWNEPKLFSNQHSASDMSSLHYFQLNMGFLWCANYQIICFIDSVHKVPTVFVLVIYKRYMVGSSCKLCELCSMSKPLTLYVKMMDAAECTGLKTSQVKLYL